MPINNEITNYFRPIKVLATFIALSRIAGLPDCRSAGLPVCRIAGLPLPDCGHYSTEIGQTARALLV
jgi:hypothetical protein